MSTKFDLLSLSEEALARLYAERIEPILRTQESERGKAMIVFRGRAVLVVLGAMAAAALAWWLFQDIFYVLFAGVGIGSIGLVYAYQPLQEVANATKQQSLTTIAEAIGCDYRLAGFQTAGVRQLEELKLLPSCDRASYQDCFSGKHAGCAFSFHDGHRERRVKTKNGERWDTVFRGQLIRVAFPKQFLGTTVIRRDAGLFNFMQRWFTELQRVGLGDSRLEKAFEHHRDRHRRDHAPDRSGADCRAGRAAGVPRSGLKRNGPGIAEPVNALRLRKPIPACSGRSPVPCRLS